MPERAALEERLQKVQADLDEATRSFEASVEMLGTLLGSNDGARITATKDQMHLWSDAMRSLAEEERTINRRLDHLASKELAHSAMKAVRSASRAAWATFWVAVLAIVASMGLVTLALVTPRLG
jgi:hypothetical protein